MASTENRRIVFPSAPDSKTIIDKEGDVLIETGHKGILVSSKVLSMASSMFDAMFHSGFSEGTTKRSPEAPLRLPLPDDDPEALEIFLHVLHFCHKRPYATLDINNQVLVAKLADKYQARNAVYGQSGRWLRRTLDKPVAETLPEKPLDRGLLWKVCTAAFLTDNDDSFRKATLLLAKDISQKEISTQTIDEMLPESLLELLDELRGSMARDIILELEKSIDELRFGSDSHTTEWKICSSCFKMKPPATKTCHQCGKESVFFPSMCLNS